MTQEQALAELLKLASSKENTMERAMARWVLNSTYGRFAGREEKQ